MISSLDQDHIEIVLKTERIGHLACAADDQPYVVPITFVYEDGYVYAHTNDGMKVDFMRRNPKVCFEVDKIESMKSWRSVVAKGIYEELDGQAAAQALDLMISRLSAAPTSETLDLGDGLGGVASQIKLKPTKGVTFRIRLLETSGLYERH